METKEMIIAEADVEEVNDTEEAVEVEEVKEPTMLDNIMNVLNDCRDENERTYNWNGIEIKIKRNLSIFEMKILFDEIYNRCFSTDDGSYQPEYRDFAERASIISLYSDAELPADIMDQYDLVYKTDLYNFVTDHVDVTQFSAVLDAVDEKVKDALDEKKRELEKSIEMISSLTDTLNSAFGDIDSADISAVLKNISENGFDEKAIVDAVINR